MIIISQREIMYIHKYPTSIDNNDKPLISGFDPGMSLGIMIYNYQLSKTVAAGLTVICTKATWETCCMNLYNELDIYTDKWKKSRVIVVERQTKQNDKITMIEAYIISYFMRYNCYIISLERRTVFTYMKQFIPDLKMKREILKSEFVKYTLSHIDDFGKKVLATNKRNHDIADCYIMIKYIIHILIDLVVVEESV